MATDNADYYMLVNEWVWSKSQDCLLRPEVDMGAVLESEISSQSTAILNMAPIVQRVYYTCSTHTPLQHTYSWSGISV